MIFFHGLYTKGSIDNAMYRQMFGAVSEGGRNGFQSNLRC